ncbi:hypothetical protein [Streptomyces prunicolor]|uniref:Uncharacterized protein n=1 Tax=Streptomyces prunicolor TaxID=67348 RepID=A0ABU4F777_9ACTN|nr:hypothetical protein [Streptomyces prunicolor]MCX5239241.1 hypothetical protein [Streptomyces prunicolor]MDV7216446.1 hypothetical protein [Streptomyces prunicolor]
MGAWPAEQMSGAFARAASRMPPRIHHRPHVLGRTVLTATAGIPA